MKVVLFAAFGLIFIVTSVLLLGLISDVQKKPYMDEIFHIPQAQQYCDGNFTHWDPMITTLPGLYLASVGIVKPVAAMLDLPVNSLCSVYWLRATNVLFSVGIFYLIYLLLLKLHNPVFDPDGIKVAMTTVALSTLPVLYFFTFLYYTDPGSTFVVLIMYLFTLQDNHIMAALLGVVAIVFRQTNIVWVFFMAGLTVRKELDLFLRQHCEKKNTKYDNLDDIAVLKLFLNAVLDFSKRKSTVSLLLKILKQVWIYILVGIGFGAFLILNEGIVVGARTQHTAVPHFPQLFYFLSLTNFFAAFHLCSPYKVLGFLKFCKRHPLFLIFFITVALVMVNYFTYEHEYLLADNRHYTFYIWRKIYHKHELVKFALIPAYLYFFWSVIDELKYRDIFWKILYVTCLTMSLVPQKLLEFRYFIIPYLIFRMNMRYGTTLGLFHEILLNIAVNAATIYLFVSKPFSWSHESGTQRFIW